MCEECHGMYSNCPLCSGDGEDIVTYEEMDLRDANFTEIKDEIGVRFKLYTGDKSFTDKREFNNWRSAFLRKYGQSNIAVEKTVSDSGYVSGKYYIGNSKLSQDQTDYFNKINKYLGI